MQTMNRDVQRTRTVTPRTVFTKLCPGVIIGIEIVSVLISDTFQDTFAKTGTNVDHD